MNAEKRLLWIVDSSCSRGLLHRMARLESKYPGTKIRVLARDSSIADALAAQGIHCSTESAYAPPVLELYRDARAGAQLMEQIERAMLPSGDTVRSLSFHGGTCLWDLQRVDLLLYGFERLVRQADNARAILD